MFSKQNKLFPDWLRDLPTTLTDQGCEVVARDVYQPSKELARAWSDNLLLVWQGVISMLPKAPVPLPAGMGFLETISRKGYAELLAKAVEECSKGATMNMVQNVFVARKPS